MDAASLNMGKPVQIVSIGQDRTVELNTKELERILLSPKVKDKAVAVVSIIGAFRKGKSFLLNFLLRYLRSRDKFNWMGDEDTPLSGFSWSTGTDPNTEGILLWDEVFLVPTPSGEELAVLLMDTQGAFDSNSSADETANIFALSILTSSVQIYNISQNIQEDNLQHLQLVVEYGNLAQKGTNERPFQKLVFLIRDWQFPDEAAYGAKGGHELLTKFMSTHGNQHNANRQLRQHLSSCFSSIDCFLMPYTGKGITQASYDGRLSPLDDDFKRELRVLVPWLMETENLHAKKIAGQEITCDHLMQYFKVYVNVFKDSKRPRVATILQATEQESNREAKEKAKLYYLDQMNKASCKNLQSLQEMHKKVAKEAKNFFRETPKIGGEEVARQYKKSLKEEITVLFNSFCYKQKLADLEEKEREIMVHSKDCDEKLKALNEKESEFYKQMEALSSKCDDLSEKKKEFDNEREQLMSRTKELQKQHEAVKEKRKKLEEEREKFISDARKRMLGTGIASLILLPASGALFLLFPPAGIVAGAVTSAVIGAFASAADEKKRLSKE